MDKQVGRQAVELKEKGQETSDRWPRGWRAGDIRQMVEKAARQGRSSLLGICKGNITPVDVRKGRDKDSTSLEVEREVDRKGMSSLEVDDKTGSQKSRRDFNCN